ncbi:MAG: transcription repressor NadR [Oscillospiraceae bacterium]|nr:transcription repressor NadR [Oscillospiraceae bacterium]
MKGEVRRTGILDRLERTKNPVPASALAAEFGVSRQIIVKDIARLREEGKKISALSRGYVLETKKKPTKVIKTIHSDEDVGRELNLIVDSGGCVEDVFVYHKFYNTIRAEMNIRTRNDVESFIKNITEGNSSLLKNITSGYHYHTISADDAKTLELIMEKLWEVGFLAPLCEFEPEEVNRKV